MSGLDIIVSRAEYSALQVLHKSSYALNFARFGLNRDWVMLNHLRAVNLDTRLAENNLLKTLHFYEITKIDAIRSMNINKLLPLIAKSFEGGVFNSTNDGIPVIIQDWSHFDGWRLFEELPVETVRDFFLNKIEQIVHSVLPVYSEVAGRRIGSVIVINNMSNFNMLQMKTRLAVDLTKEFISQIQDCYPGLLEEMYFINCSQKLYDSLEFLNSSIDPFTSQKIKIFPNNAKEHLLKKISISQFPFSMGGYNSSSLLEMIGPAQRELEWGVANNTVFLQNIKLEEKWFYGQAVLNPNTISDRTNSTYINTNSSMLNDSNNDDHFVYDSPGKLISNTRKISTWFECTPDNSIPRSIKSKLNRKIILLSTPRYVNKKEHEEALKNIRIETPASIQKLEDQENVITRQLQIVDNQDESLFENEDVHRAIIQLDHFLN